MRTALAALIVILAAVGVGAAARDHRPAPFGDAVVVHSNDTVSSEDGGAFRIGADGSVQVYATKGSDAGHTLWSYKRPGSEPVSVVPLAGITVAVWDDGMLTGVRSGSAPEVAWHRFVPGLADRLRQYPADTGVLVASLGHGKVFLVPTPQVVMEYNTADGSIRSDTLPQAGCSYAPAQALALDDLLVLARPCDERSTVEAFDGTGRLWQIGATPLAMPVATGTTTVGIREVPWLRTLVLQRATGRPAAALPIRQLPGPR
ncbi:hypothetical protein [Streptacidiphilus carbonis]|jgi:hypothetical protein|uniref:hypothetical protein n=1 Tax=Streptacidiphilus carbonis TaxID=105422 RepID=UPI0005A6EB34|nr:hypothetical protein [Streptacidiphilus carbonis]